MADKIKKIKIKQADGNFGDYIPLGADAANVDLTDGSNVEATIGNIKTQLEEPIEYTEINNTPDLTVYVKTENLSKVATSNDYNDLDNKPEIINYELPIATQTTLGGVKIDGSSITINDGIISAHTISLAPTIATSSSPGIVQPDNSTITVDASGVISAVLSSSNSSGFSVLKGSYTGDSTGSKKRAIEIGVEAKFIIIAIPGNINNTTTASLGGLACLTNTEGFMWANYGGANDYGYEYETLWETASANSTGNYLSGTTLYVTRAALNYSGSVFHYIAFY